MSKPPCQHEVSIQVAFADEQTCRIEIRRCKVECGNLFVSVISAGRSVPVTMTADEFIKARKTWDIAKWLQEPGRGG